MATGRRLNWNISLHTDAARQAQEYDLSSWAVFAASNSGKTSEVIRLFQQLKAKNNKHLFGLTASDNSKLAELATGRCYVLRCGLENAVAATKSVIEMALFYQAMLEHGCGIPLLGRRCKQLAEDMKQAMTLKIDPKLIDRIASAGTIYFAGRNDGVAEELTLKANEITRKKSDFLEGTYAVHGIEEVMDKNDVVIWLDPYDDSLDKFRDVLVKGVGLTVITVGPKATSFPSIVVPESELQPYVLMAAGWSILVDVGVKLGINLDKPVRARKVGNEFTG
jgi:glucosamine--fructose-6-phosphate aminotransferase (isomerizing)